MRAWTVIAVGLITASTAACGASSPASSPPRRAGSGVAAALPAGCKLGYRGQAIGAFTGRPMTFPFEGYNVVPPGHRAADVRITWGDGAISAGTARIRDTEIVPGCVVTIFSGRHTYADNALECTSGVCDRVFAVRVDYVDAQTRKRGTMDQLRVEVVRPIKPKTARSRHKSRRARGT